MTAADKPGADLVALLLQFEASAGERASMYLTGAAAAAAIRAWCDLRGHHLVIGSLRRADCGKTIEWSHYEVSAGDDPILPKWQVTCSLHDDHEVTEPAAQADQQVLARVKAALDGEQPEAAEGSV